MSSVLQRVVTTNGRQVVSCAQCNLAVYRSSATAPFIEVTSSESDASELGLMLIMEIACLQQIVERMKPTDLAMACKVGHTRPEALAATLTELAQKVLGKPAQA